MTQHLSSNDLPDVLTVRAIGSECTGRNGSNLAKVHDTHAHSVSFEYPAQLHLGDSYPCLPDRPGWNPTLTCIK